MAEVVEYTLVVLVSVLFVGGSAYVYTSFASIESQAQLRAASATVSALVDEAVRNGSSLATISLPSSTISCTAETLRLSTSSATDAIASPLACDFEVTVTGGAHTIQFFSSHSQLTIRVA
jgi:uncharacterized protein (UPF0333 family)